MNAPSLSFVASSNYTAPSLLSRSLSLSHSRCLIPCLIRVYPVDCYLICACTVLCRICQPKTVRLCDYTYEIYFWCDELEIEVGDGKLIAN